MSESPTPAPVTCSSCGKEMEIGDYPFCPHESIYHQNSLHFDPIVLHRDPTSGEYSVPAHNRDPTPAGYERIEITNMRDADKHIRHMDTRARSEMADKRDLNRMYFEERTKERRERVDRLLSSGAFSPRARYLAEKVREFADKKRERKYNRSLDPRTHFQALSFDSSNRMSYSSRETGHRDVKR